MSINDLPDEILIEIFNKFDIDKHYTYSQHYVMLHINKSFHKNVKQWFNNNRIIAGKYSLPLWACHFKRKKNPFILVEWVKSFGIPFTSKCFTMPIVNNDIKLINYLLTNNCGTDEYLLGSAIDLGTVETFNYFLKSNNSNLEVNHITAPFLLESLAKKGCYNMLKKYLGRFRPNNNIYSIVISSKYLHSSQKLKIIKLLYNNYCIDNETACFEAITQGEHIVLEWLLTKGFVSTYAYRKAASINNSKAIALLLKHNYMISRGDSVFIKECVTNGILSVTNERSSGLLSMEGILNLIKDY